MLLLLRLEKFAILRWREFFWKIKKWSRYKVKRREAPPSQPTCSSGALRSVGCFGCANSRLSSVITQKQMCAKYRTLPAHYTAIGPRLLALFAHHAAAATAKIQVVEIDHLRLSPCRCGAGKNILQKGIGIPVFPGTPVDCNHFHVFSFSCR